MKGICFKEPLFIATIEGRKTQTRRIMKTQPEDGQGYLGMQDDYAIFIGGKLFKPRYKVGEKVYLKEPYATHDVDCGKLIGTAYRYGVVDDVFDYYKFKNKLFMPEKFARYFIEITAVRCERLQDISENDCIREGIIKLPNPMKIYHFEHKQNDWGWTSPIGAYAELTDKIYGKGTWESNHYVWVYDYKLIK